MPPVILPRACENPQSFSRNLRDPGEHPHSLVERSNSLAKWIRLVRMGHGHLAARPHQRCGGASARRCGFVDGEIAARRAKSAVAQRAAKRALNPSTMVGWESTASRSVVAGISAIITACTVPIISPASAARMVHPRIL